MSKLIEMVVSYVVACLLRSSRAEGIIETLERDISKKVPIPLLISKVQKGKERLQNELQTCDMWGSPTAPNEFLRRRMEEAVRACDKFIQEAQMPSRNERWGRIGQKATKNGIELCVRPSPAVERLRASLSKLRNAISMKNFSPDLAWRRRNTD